MIFPQKKVREDFKLASFALEHISEAVFLVSHNAQVHYANKEAARSLGLSQERLQAMFIYDFAPSASRERFSSIWQQIRLKKQIEFQGTHRHKDGHEFPVNLKASLFEYQGDEYILVLARDLSEASELINDLETVRSQAQKYLDIAEVMLIALDREGRVTMANRYACETLGHSEANILNADWFNLTIPDHQKKNLKSVFQQIISGTKGSSVDYENEVLDSTGKELTIAWHNALIHDESGEITGVLSSGRDITSQRKDESYLKEKNRFLRSLLDTIPTPIFYKDNQFRFLGCNTSFSDLFHLTPQEVIGKTLFDIAPEETASYYHKIEQFLIKTPGKQITKWKPQEFNDSQSEFIVHTASFLSKDGIVDGFIGVLFDITSRIETERTLDQERALLRTLIDTIPDMIFIKNTGNEFMGCNKSFERYSGIPEQQLVGKDDLGLLPPDVAEFNREQEQKILQTRETQLNEEWIPYKEGGGGLYETIKAPFYDTDESIKGLIGISRNITERRKTENNLLHLSSLNELSVTLSKNLLSTDREHVGNIIEDTLSGFGKACRIDRCFVARPGKDKNSMRISQEWCDTDIPSLKNSQKNFSTESFPTILRQLSDGETVTILDTSQLKDQWKTDHKSLELRGVQSLVLVPMLDADDLTGFMAFESIRFRRAWLAEEVRILQLLADLIVAFHIHDNTTQQLEKSRNELALSNQKLLQEHQLFIGGPAMVFRWQTVAGQPLLFCSDNITNILGYSPESLVNGDILFSNLLHPDDRDRIIDEVDAYIDRHIDIFEQEYRLRHQNGTYRFFYDFTRVIRDENDDLSSLHGYVLDITHQKEDEENRIQIERELQQAQKMEALGQLSGGVAHEFNNMLSVIIGHHDLLKEQLGDDSSKNKQYLKHIEIAALRAKNLARQLLTYSQPVQSESKRVNMQNLVEEVINLSRATLPTSINIECSLENHVPDVFIDPGEIHQVLMNLIVNARDAMHASGNLSITLSKTKIEQEECQSCHAMIEGNWISLIVSDSGTGISLEEISRIFDPFYTTKSAGEGTGLGLSVVQSIMERNGGHILVDSDSHTGTEFRLLFTPMNTDETATEVSAVREKRPAYPELSGHILIIDDEEGLTEYLSELLQNCGLTVTCMNDSIKARDLLMQADTDFDLIISDQTMPDLTGIDLAREILSSQNKIPIVLCSGYSTAEDIENAKSIGIKEILQKPVASDELLHILSQHLEPTAPQKRIH